MQLCLTLLFNSVILPLRGNLSEFQVICLAHNFSNLEDILNWNFQLKFTITLDRHPLIHKLTYYINHDSNFTIPTILSFTPPLNQVISSHYLLLISMSLNELLYSKQSNSKLTQSESNFKQNALHMLKSRTFYSHYTFLSSFSFLLLITI